MRKVPCIALASLVFLGGCATGENDASLTPAERQLRHRNAQFNQTIGMGALTGGLLGAGIGALAGGGKGALIGGLSGVAAGAGTGYWVAHRTEGQQNQEDQLNQNITEAQKAAAQAQQDTLTAQTITQQAQLQLTNLNAQYRAHQITAQQYQAQTAHFRTDAQELNELAQSHRKNADSMLAAAKETGNASLQQSAQVELNSATSLAQESATITALSATASSLGGSANNVTVGS